MVLCTTRGYILEIWGQFGGNGEGSDVNLWTKIMGDATEDPDGKKKPNIASFFDLKNNRGKYSVVVDRGFKNAQDDEGFIQLISPSGKVCRATTLL